jgi:hypothetical protein
MSEQYSRRYMYLLFMYGLFNDTVGNSDGRMIMNSELERGVKIRGLDLIWDIIRAFVWTG